MPNQLLKALGNFLLGNEKFQRSSNGAVGAECLAPGDVQSEAWQHLATGSYSHPHAYGLQPGDRGLNGDSYVFDPRRTTSPGNAPPDVTRATPGTCANASSCGTGGCGAPAACSSPRHSHAGPTVAPHPSFSNHGQAHEPLAVHTRPLPHDVHAAPSAPGPEPLRGDSLSDRSPGCTSPMGQQGVPNLLRVSRASFSDATASAAGEALRQASMTSSKAGFSRDNLVAYMRWVRASRGVLQLAGKTLARNPHPQLLLRCEHWLEVTDEQHRYGSNLRVYFDYWVAEMEAAELTPPPSPALMSPSPSHQHLEKLAAQYAGATPGGATPGGEQAQSRAVGSSPLQHSSVPAQEGQGQHGQAQGQGTAAACDGPDLAAAAAVAASAAAAAAQMCAGRAPGAAAGAGTDGGAAGGAASVEQRDGSVHLGEGGLYKQACAAQQAAGAAEAGAAAGPEAAVVVAAAAAQAVGGDAAQLHQSRRHSCGEASTSSSAQDAPHTHGAPQPGHQHHRMSTDAAFARGACAGAGAAGHTLACSAASCRAASTSVPGSSPGKRSGSGLFSPSSRFAAAAMIAMPGHERSCDGGEPGREGAAQQEGAGLRQPWTASSATPGGAGGSPAMVAAQGGVGGTAAAADAAQRHSGGASSSTAAMAAAAAAALAGMAAGSRAAKAMSNQRSAAVGNGSNFFRWLDHGAGREVDLVHLGVARAKLDAERVKYLTPQELLEYELDVEVETGLLRYKASGKLLHTGPIDGRASLDDGHRRPPTPPPPAVPLPCGDQPWAHPWWAAAAAAAATSGSAGGAAGDAGAAGASAAAAAAAQPGSTSPAGARALGRTSTSVSRRIVRRGTLDTLHEDPSPGTRAAPPGAEAGAGAAAAAPGPAGPSGDAAVEAAVAAAAAAEAAAEAAGCAPRDVRATRGSQGGDAHAAEAAAGVCSGLPSGVTSASTGASGSSPDSAGSQPTSLGGACASEHGPGEASAASAGGAAAGVSDDGSSPHLPEPHTPVKAPQAAGAGGGCAPAALQAAGHPHREDKVAKWIYVVDPELRLFVHPKVRGSFHHSSFLRGGAVVAAGGLAARHGQLRLLTADSGHYWPREENFRWLCEHLVSVGADLSHCDFRSKHMKVPAPTGRALMERMGVPPPSPRLHRSSPWRLDQHLSLPVAPAAGRPLDASRHISSLPHFPGGLEAQLQPRLGCDPRVGCVSGPADLVGAGAGGPGEAGAEREGQGAHQQQQHHGGSAAAAPPYPPCAAFAPYAGGAGQWELLPAEPSVGGWAAAADCGPEGVLPQVRSRPVPPAFAAMPWKTDSMSTHVRVDWE